MNLARDGLFHTQPEFGNQRQWVQGLAVGPALPVWVSLPRQRHGWGYVSFGSQGLALIQTADANFSNHQESRFPFLEGIATRYDYAVIGHTARGSDDQ